MPLKEIPVLGEPPRKKIRYRRVPAHPASKPRSLQWCKSYTGGCFICGKCKSLYRSRILLHIHKQEKCYNPRWHEDQRWLRTIKSGTKLTKL